MMTMKSRNQILSTVKNNQPSFVSLPLEEKFEQDFTDVCEKYKTILESIGGNVHEVNNADEIINIVKQQFSDAKRIVCTTKEFEPVAELFQPGKNNHLLHDVEVAIIPAHFAVAENGAIWITEDLIK